MTYQETVEKQVRQQLRKRRKGVILSGIRKHPAPLPLPAMHENPRYTTDKVAR